MVWLAVLLRCAEKQLHFPFSVVIWRCVGTVSVFLTGGDLATTQQPILCQKSLMLMRRLSVSVQLSLLLPYWLREELQPVCNPGAFRPKVQQRAGKKSALNSAFRLKQNKILHTCQQEGILLCFLLQCSAERQVWSVGRTDTSYWHALFFIFEFKYLYVHVLLSESTHLIQLSQNSSAHSKVIRKQTLSFFLIGSKLWGHSELYNVLSK